MAGSSSSGGAAGWSGLTLAKEHRRGEAEGGARDGGGSRLTAKEPGARPTATRGDAARAEARRRGSGLGEPVRGAVARN